MTAFILSCSASRAYRTRSPQDARLYRPCGYSSALSLTFPGENYNRPRARHAEVLNSCARVPLEQNAFHSSLASNLLRDKGVIARRNPEDCKDSGTAASCFCLRLAGHMRPFSGRGVYICANTMRIRVPSSTVLFICLLSMSAAAQHGLRSGSPSEGTSESSSSVSEGRDLFRVPPDFYNRPPDPGPSRLFFPYFLPAPAPAPDWYFRQSGRIPVPLVKKPNRAREDLPETTVLPSPTVAPLVPGEPKTFYVIPGCYAGDKPPEPEWLPEGCDRSRIRAIPAALDLSSRRSDTVAAAMDEIDASLRHQRRKPSPRTRSRARGRGCGRDNYLDMFMIA